MLRALRLRTQVESQVPHQCQVTDEAQPGFSDPLSDRPEKIKRLQEILHSRNLSEAFEEHHGNHNAHPNLLTQS